MREVTTQRNKEVSKRHGKRQRRGAENAKVRGEEERDFTAEGTENTERKKSKRLARWGIGDFTKDGGAACAGGGGKIRGAAVEGFVGQNGESKSFLGIFGDAQFWRADNFDLWKRGGQLREDQRVVGAAAGDDELIDFRFGQDKTV